MPHILIKKIRLETESIPLVIGAKRLVKDSSLITAVRCGLGIIEGRISRNRITSRIAKVPIAAIAIFSVNEEINCPIAIKEKPRRSNAI